MLLGHKMPFPRSCRGVWRGGVVILVLQIRIGVFSCPSGKNPMYTYREKIVLGTTNCSIFKVNQILRELIREWPGNSYDLLSENCNHFCDEFCDRLAVPKLLGLIFLSRVGLIVLRMLVMPPWK